mgnify:CR=1 FL=1
MIKKISSLSTQTSSVGSTPENCMSFAEYERMCSSGELTHGVYVCGIGYCTPPAVVYGCGCGSGYWTEDNSYWKQYWGCGIDYFDYYMSGYYYGCGDYYDEGCGSGNGGDNGEVPDTGNDGSSSGTGGGTGGSTGGNSSGNEAIEYRNKLIAAQPFPTAPDFSADASCVRVYSVRHFKNDVSTLSKFTAAAYGADGNLISGTLLEGYFLERVLDYSLAQTSGSNTAILKGEYSIIPGVEPQRFEWYLVNVPGRAGVAIHKGNSYYDTEGCLLIGEIGYYDKESGHNTNAYKVKFSEAWLKKLGVLFRTYGNGNIKIIITEQF